MLKIGYLWIVVQALLILEENSVPISFVSVTNLSDVSVNIIYLFIYLLILLGSYQEL